ncbi:VOC family protein [Candidatus Palauibacter sp.]|uniref:VOC family protein n=1 Tax=Candidatus Palauibacter sp. TaxID=3101350 RepID=UPI003AF25A50
MPPNLDHLLLGTADLRDGVAWVADRLGVEAVFGGRHANLGTANYLLSLGSDIYLEILGPDPEAPSGGEPPPFGIAELEEPRLITWAARATNLAALAAQASDRGVPLGPVRPGSRLRPDGSELRWEVTALTAFLHDGLVPFFIDWGTTPHPARATPAGGQLLSFRAEHPDPAAVRSTLAALSLALEVDEGPEPALLAGIRTLSGDEVELR